MPILSNTLRRVRTSGPNPVLREEAGAWLWDTRSVTGATVTDDTALGLTAFYRGVSLIASTVGRLPMHVYRKGAGTERGEPVQTPETRYLWGRPNHEMRRGTFWELIVGDIVRGNAFIWVDKEPGSPEPAGIWYLNRQRVRVGRTRDGRKVYEVDGEIPMIDYTAGGEIVHIPNWGGGLVGYDIVKVAPEALGLGLSAQEYAARFFTNDGVPPGVITTDAVLTPEESERIADRWMKRQAGTRNARKIAVLGGGAQYQAVASDLEKAQMMEMRRFSIGDVARLLGLPPHMLGDVERSTSWGAGISEQERGFLVYTQQGHIDRVEEGISEDLLVKELTGRYAKLDTGGLLRGTTLQRYQAYALGYGRWLTPNDIRRDEDLEPIEGGDVLPAAANLVPIDQLGSNFREDEP